MNLVFMNSMEKMIDEGRVTIAKVMIGENQGVWHVQWEEPAVDSASSKLDSWYEGSSWEEMLAVFREMLQQKISQGFHPLIDHYVEEGTSAERMKYNQMLQFYGETFMNPTLFDALKAWRYEQAKKESKVAYIIASNKMLQMLSAFVPYNAEELKQIPGFGDRKAAAYGQAILAITSKAARTTNFPLDWISVEVDQYQFSRWLQVQRELKVKKAIDRKTHLRKLLEGINAGEDIKTLHESFQIGRRELILEIEQLDTEGYDVDPIITTEMTTVSEADYNLAWKTMGETGIRFLKPIVEKLRESGTLNETSLERVYEWLRLLRIRFKHENERQLKAS